jgi:hypothetical protein
MMLTQCRVRVVRMSIAAVRITAAHLHRARRAATTTSPAALPPTDQPTLIAAGGHHPHVHLLAATGPPPINRLLAGSDWSLGMLVPECVLQRW